MTTDKAILYRAWHRGTQEADRILGTFAQHHLASLDEASRHAFSGLLLQDDPVIFDKLACKQEEPDPVLKTLLYRIEDHTQYLYEEAAKLRQLANQKSK